RRPASVCLMPIVNKGSESDATRLRPREQVPPTDVHRSVRATIIFDGDWLVCLSSPVEPAESPVESAECSLRT
ncbi:MAG: hypothetical protein ACK55S_11375, partial [Planctomycetota bacterium]